MASKKQSQKSADSQKPRENHVFRKVGIVNCVTCATKLSNRSENCPLSWRSLVRISLGNGKGKAGGNGMTVMRVKNTMTTLSIDNSHSQEEIKQNRSTQQ